MKLSNPSIVMNFSDWIPEYGENKCILHCKDSTLDVEIFYDGELGEVSKKIRFQRAVSFYKGTVPGPSMLKNELNEISISSGVVKYLTSPIASQWSMHVSIGEFNHYSIFLQEEGIVLHVIATACDYV